MAVSGGCTSSYKYEWRGGQLTVTSAGARLWSQCDSVAEACAYRNGAGRAVGCMAVCRGVANAMQSYS